MAGTIIWQDPPAPMKGRERTVELDALAAELKAHPGRWALVATNPYPGASKQYKNRGLQVITRTRPDGKYDVYARAPERW